MKEIKLTQGMVAKVDDEDYGWLSEFNWFFDRYAYRTVQKNNKKRSVRMHRLIADKMFKEIPVGLDVDHINRDKLDNRRENLRLLTRSENILNSEKSINSTGVYWDKARKRWKSHVRGKDLGRFDTREEALSVSRDYLGVV